MTLQMVLRAAELDNHQCAAALGVNPRVFAEWASGQSRVPESFVPLLSAVLGVAPTVLATPARAIRRLSEADVTPQIWYKFRGSGLTSTDRDFVLLVRQIGHYLNELEEITEERSLQWKTLFQAIRDSIDMQAPLREQGRVAAREFRAATPLGHGALGSGEILRGLLRNLGLLMVEVPLAGSRLEGCNFLVGGAAKARPCVFANSHRTTWFRRNVVLMHEVAHAIFEYYLGASLDYFETKEPGSAQDSDAEQPCAARSAGEIEIRAQAFAQECLLPREVLRHAAQSNGVRWDRLTAEDLARLVASVHVEQSLVLDVAAELEFINGDDLLRARNLDISQHLRNASPHALTTTDYLKKSGKSAEEWLGKRNTTLFPRATRLPVGYVKRVVEAYKSRQISPAKAARYLMIAEEDLFDRFGDIYDQNEW